MHVFEGQEKVPQQQYDPTNKKNNSDYFGRAARHISIERNKEEKGHTSTRDSEHPPTQFLQLGPLLRVFAFHGVILMQYEMVKYRLSQSALSLTDREVRPPVGNYGSPQVREVTPSGRFHFICRPG